MNLDVDAARAALPPLDWRAPVVVSALQPYVQYYELDFTGRIAGVTHGIGYLEVAGFRIAVQVFRVPGARGTALALHGYYDHVGIYDHVIAHALARGLDVVAFDLPGHGLSSGERAAIDDFAQYQAVLAAVIAGMHTAGFARPWHLLGQSTGGGIIMDYLLHAVPGSVPFTRAVLLAPLVRPAHWAVNRIVYQLVRPFRRAIARKFVTNSHDEDFLRFLREEDPLQPRMLSTRWVGAMKDWFPRIERAAPSGFPLCVVQGDEDGTVDWRHNLGVVRQKFPHAQVHVLPGGRHQLVNESSAWRTQVFDIAGDYLDAEQPDAE